jgi:parvulin-like peptidyl-prolyl isomerase
MWSVTPELPVSDEEIREHFKKYYDDDTPFTQDIHMSIEAVLRKQQFKDKLATLRERLRKGVEVQVFEDKLDAGGDTDRKSSEVVATAGDESITWGQVRQKLTMAGQDNSPAARRERLENFIDSRIMVQKARAADLEQDAGYQRRLKEFRKSSLVNIHRARLAEEMSPTDDEIRDYYRQNRDQIVVHELRKVQMVVMKTEDEAAEVKQKIESGEITFFQAASEYSIDPNAKMNLGELGWVPQGTGFPELDKVTFALNPNEIGGPVESPAGWHLVKVLDVRDGDFQDIEDRDTWKKTRRLLVKEKENRYVAGLRKTNFSVEVYDDVFSRLTQKEVDALKASQQSAATGNGDT